MSELLGQAILELDVDLKPLDRGLATAEARTAKSVAAMQALLDSLEAEVDIRVNEAEALAQRLAASAIPRSGETVVVERPGAPAAGAGSEVWGIRGPQHAGSLTNPIVTVLAAAKLFPMGSYAAAIGEGNESDVQRGDQSSGVASAADLAALTAAVQDLAQNVSPGQQLATAGAQGIAEPGAATRTIVVLDDQNSAALDRAAMALEVSAAALSRPQPASGSAAHTIVIEQPRSTATRGGPVIFTPAGQSGSGGHPPVFFTWPGQGDGGGVRPPVVVGGAGGGGQDSNFWRNVLFGRGRFGLASAATLGSFAGLGPEHLLFTLLGLAGSAASAVGGAGLLALGSLGKIGVGGGSDILASRTAAQNVKTLNTDVNNLNQAIAIYGKNSKQAAAAQAQLNYDLKGMGAAGPVAMNVVRQFQALDNQWATVSVAAQKQADAIFSQILVLASQFAPRVALAAQQNLSIVNTGLKPLFAWLQGPHGIGIWDNLENNFRHDLPYAIQAFNQGMELLLRVTSLASNYTGGLTQMLDRLFTRLNGLSDAQLNTEIGKLVNDFHLWDQFIKLLITDLYDLFHQDAQTGQSIIVTLTGMLEKLKEWETSTQGASELHNIFEVHKQEVLQLLRLLPELISGFGSVYLTVAPAATLAFTDFLKVINLVLQGIDDLGPAARTLLGFALVAAKVGVLGSALRGVGGALGLISAQAPRAAAGLAEVDAAAAAGTAAGGAGTVEGAAGGSLLSRLAPGAMAGSLATRAGLAAGESGLLGFSGAEIAIMTRAAIAPVLAGAGGMVAGSIVQSLTGLRGGFAGTVGGGVAGGALGAALASVIPGVGTVVGGLLGSAIGSTFGPSIGHLLSSLFDGTDYGKRFADQFTSQFTGMVPPQVTKSMHDAVDQAFNQIHNVKFNTTSPFSGQALPGQAKQLAQAYSNLGKVVGQQFVDGLKNVPFPTTLVFLNDFTQELDKLPPQSRAKAAQAMVAFAQQLQDAGRLPKNAVTGIVAGIESAFPGLTNALRRAGVSVAGSLQGIEGETTKTIATVRGDFGALNIDPNVTGKNLLSNVTTTWEDLRMIIGTTSGQARQEAIAQMQQLKREMGALLSGLEVQVAGQMALIKGHVTGASAVAAVEGSSSFKKFSQAIYAYMNAGALNSGQGARQIITELNRALKELGQPQLTPIQVEGIAQNALTQSGAQTPGGGVFFGGAAGALMQVGRPGEAGRDSVPLNVGGYPIMVAPGEQVAVFNRHQLPIVNAALAGYGGLPGLFRNVRTPHYMASGGIVTASEYGGPTDPGTGSVGYRGDNLYVHPDSYAELNMGTALGGLPYMTPLDVTYHGRTAKLFKRDIGAGGPGLNGHPRAIDLWFQAAQALGFPIPGLEDVLINGPAGVNITIGGGGLGSVAAPRVSGSGALASLLRSGFSKVAAAANAYIARVTPKINVGVLPTGSPVGHGAYGALTLGRTDQGVDFGGAGPVYSVLPGHVVEMGLWPGWPGVGGVVYSTPRGNVYVMEDFSSLVGAGQSFGAMHLIGTATGGPSGIETGWANAMATGPLTPYNGAPDGTPMPGGIDFRHFLGYAHGGLLRTLMAGGGLTGHPSGQTIDAKTGRPIPGRFLGRDGKPAKHHAPKRPHKYPGPDPIRGRSSFTGHGGKNDNQNLTGWISDIIGGKIPSLQIPLYPGMDTGFIDGFLGYLGDILGAGSHSPTGYAYLSELMNYYPGVWALQNPTAWGITTDPTQAVITTDPVTGQPVAPYLDTKDVGIATGWLQQEIGWQQQIINDIRTGMAIVSGLPSGIREQIDKRKKELKALKDRVLANVKKIKAAQKRIADAKARIKAAQATIGRVINSRGKMPGGWLLAQDAVQTITGSQKEISQDQKLIAWLEDDNKALSGAKDRLGTSGEIREVNQQLTRLDNQLGLVANPNGQYSTDALQGVSGFGGLLGPAMTNLLQLESQLRALDPDALKKLLLQAQLSGSAPPSRTMTGQVAFSFQGQTFLAGLPGGIPGFDMGGLLDAQTERFARLANMPDFAGVFHQGGVIPGPPGAERLALVQAGETITPRGQGSPVDADAIRELTAAIRENVRETRANTGALSDNTRRSNVSYSHSLSSDRVYSLGVGS